MTVIDQIGAETPTKNELVFSIASEEPKNEVGKIPEEVQRFVDFFNPPDYLDPETKEVISKVQEDLSNILSLYISQLDKSPTNAGNIEDPHSRYARACSVLGFINNVLTGDLDKNIYSNTRKVNIIPNKDSSGGFSIKIAPYSENASERDNLIFGTIETEERDSVDVGSVTITFRTGEKYEEGRGSVPMQLNISVNDFDSVQVESVRIDLHNTQNKLNQIHLDAALGNKQDSLHHAGFNSLEKLDDNEVQEYLRTLEMCFYVNLAHSLIFESIEDNYNFKLKPWVSPLKEFDANEKALLKRYYRFNNYLKNLNKTPEITSIVDGPSNNVDNIAVSEVEGVTKIIDSTKIKEELHKNNIELKEDAINTLITVLKDEQQLNDLPKTINPDDNLIVLFYWLTGTDKFMNDELSRNELYEALAFGMELNREQVKGYKLDTRPVLSVILENAQNSHLIQTDDTEGLKQIERLIFTRYMYQPRDETSENLPVEK